MGTFQVGLLLIGTFALLLALSVPVSVSIIISSVVTMASTLSLDLGTFVASQRMVGGVDSFSLLAVPFYILCGVLMNTGGIAQKLIDFAKILVGRIPGGLAHTNILGNTLFGSLSGSSVAASVAIGGVLIPMEEKEGYDKKFAAAVNIASAPTGLIIPPSGILTNPAAKMSKSENEDTGRIILMDTPETIMRQFKRAITDSDTENCVRYDKENKPGVSNLMTIYSACTGKSCETIEAEFAGQGYGAFKPAVGEAVVETLRPIREEASRIMKDKAYLEQVYKAGAEKASYVAEKTLRKVYKKVGFVAK